MVRKQFCTGLVIIIISASCSTKNKDIKEEQIRIETTDTALTDSANSINGKLALHQIETIPNNIVLTGMPQHRLVTVYKSRHTGKTTERYASTDPYYYDSEESDRYSHFMPGIDLIYGYNLLNVAHYDLTAETLNYLFEHPVLVKSLYYPSFEPDRYTRNRSIAITTLYLLMMRTPI